MYRFWPSWYRANRAQYGEVSFRAVSLDETSEVALPSMQGSEEDAGAFATGQCVNHTLRYAITALEGLESLSLNKDSDLFITPNQLDGELITLTLLPRSRWQTLLNLETIQVCNAFDIISNASLTRNGSNGISQKSLRSPQKRHRSFFPHYQVWSPNSMWRRKMGWRRRAKSQHEDWIWRLRSCKASSIKLWRLRSLMEIVSVLVPCVAFFNGLITAI